MVILPLAAQRHCSKPAVHTNINHGRLGTANQARHAVQRYVTLLFFHLTEPTVEYAI